MPDILVVLYDQYFLFQAPLIWSKDKKNNKCLSGVAANVGYQFRNIKGFGQEIVGLALLFP